MHSPRRPPSSTPVRCSCNRSHGRDFFRANFSIHQVIAKRSTDLKVGEGKDLPRRADMCVNEVSHVFCPEGGQALLLVTLIEACSMG